MIPLAILSVIAIYIFIERAIAIHKASKYDPSFMRRIKDYVQEGEIESAQNLCRLNNTPASKLVEKGISRLGRSANDILAAIENAGNIEIANLSKGLPWLATTASGAPMLGFLGTVIGMVDAFFSIANSGNAASIGDFAGGIYTALVTTVAGLVVGIIALFAYNYIVARINNVMNQLEARTMEFMDIINE
jgi:biopolymer transport protein ExbB